MRRDLATVTVAGVTLLAAACSGGTAAPDASVVVSDSASIDTSRSSESSEPLPDDVTSADSVDLGDLGPASDLTFCEAFAVTRTEWVDGAIVPLQWWITAYADVVDEPADASAPLDRLREFAELKLDWNFKRIDDRPVYAEPIARDAVALADAAADGCADLPLVVGPNAAGEPPGWWADESDESVRAMCREAARELSVAIDAYVERNGRQPKHQEQVYADAFVTWAYDGVGELVLATEYFGIRPDDDGVAVVVPVPGGGCAR